MGFITSILLVGTISVFAVSTIIDSKEVSYDNKTSKGSYDNVQNSIDELYKRYKDLSGEQDTIYTEEILNGADPVLGKDMIPITLEDDGTVKYANLYTPWYKYEYKRWANAVILVDSPSQTYKPGDIILEKDIESYFVWIPRYKYKIWNLANEDGYEYNLSNTSNDSNSIWHIRENARIIDIVFENNDTAPSTKQEMGSYYTHPAFIVFNVNGLWVGKFETGGDKNSIIVKPNVTALTNETVGSLWHTFYNYKSVNGNHNTNLDPHMIKNTEWGATAYLSHSAYGIGNEVNINNNCAILTGYSSAANTDQSGYPGTSTNNDLTLTQPYNTSIGYLASTTGNITGIYDMSGGVHESVAGYLDPYGITSSDGIASGFTAADLAKKQYFDKYSGATTIFSYSKRIIGDATGEIGPFYYYMDKSASFSHNGWYADTAIFVLPTGPWFDRGLQCDYGVAAGQFGFGRSTGEAGNRGSRLVLAVTQ